MQLVNQNILLKFTNLTHAELIEEIMKLIIQYNKLEIISSKKNLRN